jgi:hypothetical protein
LRGLGSCPLAGPGFGHRITTFPGCWGKLSGILGRCRYGIYQLPCSFLRV